MINQQTIYIVDDDDAFRDSLIWLLEGSGHHCQAYDSAETFLESYKGQPGCLLLDIRMPGISGLELQQKLNQQGCNLPVILITGHGSVTWAVQGMKNQAVDFIEKPFDDEALLSLVDKTLSLSKVRFEEADEKYQLEYRWQSLSRREKEVAQLVVKGHSNKSVAQELGITIKTVEVHRSRAMKKMGCEKLATLVETLNKLRVYPQ